MKMTTEIVLLYDLKKQRWHMDEDIGHGIVWPDKDKLWRKLVRALSTVIPLLIS